MKEKEGLLATRRRFITMTTAALASTIVTIEQSMAATEEEAEAERGIRNGKTPVERKAKKKAVKKEKAYKKKVTKKKVAKKKVVRKKAPAKKAI